MKMKKAFLANLELAQDVIVMTVEEAKSLPNMLGQIASASLNHSGWYARSTDAGVKTLYVLPENEKLTKA